MAVDPYLAWLAREEAWKQGKAPHPGPNPLARTTSVGGPNDGESEADKALRKLEKVATTAADVVISIATTTTNAPAVRLNAAKYILDMARAAKGGPGGDALIDAMKLFAGVAEQTGGYVPGVTEDRNS